MQVKLIAQAMTTRFQFKIFKFHPPRKRYRYCSQTIRVYDKETA